LTYRETLQAVDTVKALKIVGIDGGQQGAYVYFPCTGCGKQAVIKAYGDKKNIWYCPECKDKGHIISLIMKMTGIGWNEAKSLLEVKAVTYPAEKIQKELTLEYELQYNKFLEAQGISEEIARAYAIGVPKGKTMLSGCVAFTVHDENGKRIAYYGIRMKDLKPVFHSSFNPELYLYNYHRVDSETDVHFTTDMFDCIRTLSSGRQPVCNFGLPYLSTEQISFLQRFKYVSFDCSMKHSNELTHQLTTNLQNYLKIVKNAKE
jgi:hypothetical protein